MLRLTAPYQDVFGVTHQAPVVVVQQVNYSHQNATTLLAERNGDNFTYKENDVSTYVTVGFTAALFTSETAFEARFQALPLRNAQGGEYFSFQADAAIAKADLVAACEAWLLQNVFNQSQE